MEEAKEINDERDESRPFLPAKWSSSFHLFPSFEEYAFVTRDKIILSNILFYNKYSSFRIEE